METHELIGVVVALLGLLGVTGRFLWKASASLTKMSADLEALKVVVNDCQLHVSNHLPTQIAGVSGQVTAVKERLELHEEREERHWDLVNTMLKNQYEKSTG